MKFKHFGILAGILACFMLFGIFTPIKADEEVENKTLYKVSLKSTYQVKNGGSPEYTITNTETGLERTVTVDTLSGVVLELEKGKYRIKETKSSEGFSPMIKEGVELTLPHYDEFGREHESVTLDMKSEKKSTPLVWLDYKPDPKEEPKKVEEKKKEEPLDKGTPNSLGEREKLEENKEKEEDIPETPEPEENKEKKEEKEIGLSKNDNPKTGDDTFKRDMIYLAAGIFVIGLGVLTFAFKKKTKYSN